MGGEDAVNAGGGDGRIRLMVVDDHPMWRGGIARDLEGSPYQVVAEAGDGAQALRLAAAARPALVVLDLHLPDLGGVEVIRGLLAVNPELRILMLSASGEYQDVLDAVKAGATGYLLKSAGAAEFREALDRTVLGEPVFTPGLAGLVLGEFRRLAAETPKPSPDTPQLTQRETEVLRFVASGLSYRQIAHRLTLSHRTVQNHVQNTLNKLQLHNRVELARYAIREGLGDEA
ncbi:MAG TPA: response regulator transcription factor [Actinospica sp.]|jgi:DNA-binding NarL/FixJ family response regulator|nr:response regulator transcription factor [Actinospica sp.]